MNFQRETIILIHLALYPDQITYTHVKNAGFITIHFLNVLHQIYSLKHRQTKDPDDVSKVVSAKLFTFSVGECETVPVVETLRRSIGCGPISQSALVASPFTDEHPFAFSFLSYTLLRK